jgi:hypothetical protein
MITGLKQALRTPAERRGALVGTFIPHVHGTFPQQPAGMAHKTMRKTADFRHSALL